MNFVLKPGQTDYTHAKRAPVVNSVVRHEGSILLVKRSAEVFFYPGYWNGISGFLDDKKSVEEKLREELEEEARITEKDIISMKEGAVFEVEESALEKRWVIHPVLVDVRSKAITLNEEGEAYVWVSPGDASQYKLLPTYPRVIKSVL
jgi:ADP-ribose pyrophosphatase YjhB (NUDIX family)